MAYKITLIGLVCLFKEPGGGRQMLLPDGRNPQEGIDPHFAKLIVPAAQVRNGEGWHKGVSLLNGQLLFEFQAKSTITFEDADVDDVTNVDFIADERGLPQLDAFAPDHNFPIDPATADTILQFRIRRGRLTTYRFPGSKDDSQDVALISQVEVPHYGTITMNVDAEDGPKMLKVEPDTEIIIANVSSASLDISAKSESHFRIYEKLVADAAIHLNSPQGTELGIPKLVSDHPFFTKPNIIGLGAECSNGGGKPPAGQPPGQ